MYKHGYACITMTIALFCIYTFAQEKAPQVAYYYNRLSRTPFSLSIHTSPCIFTLLYSPARG